MTARVGLPARSAVAVTETDDIQSLDAFRWDELCAQCPDATVFQSRGWLQTYARVFLRSREDLKLVVATEGERLVGLAPLMRASASGRSQDVDWLILGDDYSDYQSFLAWQGSPEIIDALLDGIDRLLPAGESIAFYDVPQFSTLGLCLAARARQGQVNPGGVTACPTLQFRHNPRGVAAVLAKGSLRRSERSLNTLGTVTLEHFQSAAEITGRLPGLFAQHVSRWQGTDSPSLFRSAEPQQFYREITSVLAPAGGVHYTTVSLDGRVVAQHFGLRSRDTLLWYKPTFDLTLREHSPGDVLLKGLIQHTRDAGLSELDFSRGDESFKNRFASLVRYNRNFYWHRSVGRRAWAKLREQGRAVRDRISRQPLLAPALGGAGETSRKDLILLLNADAPTTSAWSSVAQGEGIRIRAVPCDATSELGAVQEATLVVPCDEASVSALLLLPENHPARLNAMLPRIFESTAGQPPRMVARVTCVCAGGQLIQHFAVMGGVAPGAPSEVLVLHLAKAKLDELGWHGPATVQFGANADGQITVDRVVPFLQQVHRAVKSGTNLPLSLWKLASGLGTAPQSN